MTSTEKAPSGGLFSLSDFDTLAFIGRGAFGEVTLVQFKRTTAFYAIKKIAKERIRGDKHIQHVINERNIMRGLSVGIEQTSFFVKLYQTMQDEANLYLLMEYLPGDELLKQIKQ